MIAIPELNQKGLRDFGLLFGSIILVLFGLFLPWVFNFGYPLWPWIFTAGMFAWAIVAPNTLRGFYRGWMRFGLLINKITTPIIMGLVFFAAITPMAMIMKLMRFDPMSRKLDKATESYRKPSLKRNKLHIEKPF